MTVVVDDLIYLKARAELWTLHSGAMKFIRMSHWHHSMVGDAKFWICYQQQPAFLSIYSRWQLINLVPSTIVWHQFIRIKFLKVFYILKRKTVIAYKKIQVQSFQIVHTEKKRDRITKLQFASKRQNSLVSKVTWNPKFNLGMLNAYKLIFTKGQSKEKGVLNISDDWMWIYVL